MLDYIRIACAVPGVQPGNVEKNVADICGFLRQAEERAAARAEAIRREAEEKAEALRTAAEGRLADAAALIVERVVR